ncbi:MAG: transcription initiation factor IIB family protein [Nitrososphaerota archaeon]|nr:transcription initiation factor IIB family protein [Nitrososphaerota archaeon]
MVNSSVAGIRKSEIERPVREAEKLSETLGLPEKVKDDAKVFISFALSEHRNLPILAVAAASVYAACRKNGVPVTIGEIGRSMNPKVEPSRIARYYKRLYSEVFHEQMPRVATAEKYVAKIARTEHLLPSVVSSALQLIAEAKKAGNGSLGRHPAVVGAAALYIAGRQAGLHITQRMVTTSAGLSDVGRVREAIRSLCTTAVAKQEGNPTEKG